MIQEIGAGRFRNEYRPDARPQADSRVLFYRGCEIFVKRVEGKISFLTYEELTRSCPQHGGKPVYLFSIDQVMYFLISEFLEKQSEDAAFGRMEPDEHQESEREPEDSRPHRAEEEELEALSDLFPDYGWEKIERLRGAEPAEAAFAGVTGLQLHSWYRSRRFCPACGRRTVHDARERMMRCPACGQLEYPKICPAVIVGVTCGDRLLLTKYAGRTYRHYALIAGFAEIGETIEETVQREVMEEVGLKVKKIRYYKSQPWSFTDTLLMGFFAEVDGDTRITLDQTELAEGRWCTREEIPEDDGVSLTREMMRVFKESKKNFQSDKI